MKQNLHNTGIIFFLLLFSYACEESLLKEHYDNTIPDNFEIFWSDFDHIYGAFEAKQINWDSLKTAYGKNINDKATNGELYNALCGLLNELNDGHADLYAPEFGYYRSWNRREKSYFSDVKTSDMWRVASMQQIIRSNYMKNQFQAANHSGWFFFYGTITHHEKNVGYICLPTFNISDYPREFIQAAIDSFNTLDAVIIDLRFNGGGTTEAFVWSMNSFASEKKMYMKSQFRNGPNHYNYTPMEEHWTNPHSDGLKKIPVAILMNAFSASSSDHFILGMKTQSNVITVGDTTCGAFSSVFERVLFNGWKYRLGAQVIYDTGGKPFCDQHGNYLEGIGIAPDHYAPDVWSEVIKGYDMPLEKALEALTIR